MTFKLKDGSQVSKRLAGAGRPPEPGFASQTLCGEIDFEGMYVQAADEAAADWDDVRSIRGPATVWLVRDQVSARFGTDHLGADAFYSNQSAVRLAKAAGGRPWGIDFYRGSRASHVARVRRRVFDPAAVLKDDLWIDETEGWFDIARDEREGGG